MKKKVLWACVVWLWASTPSPRAGETTITFDGEWRLPPEARIVREDKGGRDLVRVTVEQGREKGRMAVAKRTLDLSAYHGHEIELVYEARAIGVSKPGDPWNGVKLMLYYRTGEFKHWQNLPRKMSHGDFDWREVVVPLHIPPDARDGELNLGLQDSFGTLEVRSVVLRDFGPKNPYPSPVAIPEGFKAEYTERVSSVGPLRGVMSPGVYRPGDLDVLASWNANLIRWQIGRNWGATGADRDIGEYRKWLDEKLDEVEHVLADGQRLGIKVAVDLHSPPGGRRPNQVMAMFHEAKFADEFVRTWQVIAERLKGHPALWAYDLINEPTQKGMAEVDYLTLQYRAALEVRKIDPDTPIMISTHDSDIQPNSLRHFQPLPLKDIIYEVHMYKPGSFTHQKIGNTAGIQGGKETVAYPGRIENEDWNRDTMKKYLAAVREFQLKYGARLYCGEFSAVRYAPGAAKYLEDLISVFEEYGWDWSYHSFRESPYWDVEFPNDPKIWERSTEPTDRYDVLIRAFAKNKTGNGNISERTAK